MYQVKQVAEMTGVSVRTLHHYDAIGLLVPKKASNGYRQYTNEDLDRLFMILNYRFLGFDLATIQQLIECSQECHLEILKHQLDLLHDQNRRLQLVIEALQTTIESEERGIAMSIEEKFKGFNYQDHTQWEAEAKEKYGQRVVEQSKMRHQDKQEQMMIEFNQLFQQFASYLNQGIAANEEITINLAKDLHHHLCRYHFDCSLEQLAQIGQTYVADDRFKKNIDQFGSGTAAYASQAIHSYVDQNQ